MMKRFLRVMLIAVLLAAFALPSAVSAAEDRPADIPTEITIYGLDESYGEYLTIPTELPQSWSLEGHSVEWSSGCNITIDDNGTVTAYGETWYYHQIEGGWWVGSSAPSGEEGEIARFEYEFGDCIVLLDDQWKVTVHVVDYASHYAEQVMDAYLAEKVTAGMTQYQIAELCCQFVAGYDYSADHASYTGMIVKGGGDCWASTGALQYMLRQEGISCKTRSADTDYGAGDRHVNVLAELDGEYYILEAGFSEPAPRHYTIEKMESSTAFTYSKKYAGPNQYEVYITGLVLSDGVTEITIPSEIDGMPVTGIADGAFSGYVNVVSVTLPSTIRYLGEKAFYNNESLESINLPEGLETIGVNCFTYCETLEELSIPSTVKEIGGHFCYNCYNLTTINVHEDNPYLTSRDGVLFDKAMETLLIFPAGKGDYPYDRKTETETTSTYLSLSALVREYTIPDGVKSLAGWSFGQVNLKALYIPETVSDIQANAFDFARIQELTLPEGLETISSYAFKDIDTGSLVLPSTLKRIEDYAFYRCSIDTPVIIPDGVEYVGDYVFAGNLKGYVSVPASVQEIGVGAFDFDYGWSSMGVAEKVSYHDTGAIFLDRDCSPATIEEGAFDTETLCVYPDSAMHTYAVNNGLHWYPRSSDGTVELKQEWRDGISWTSDTSYTGKPVEVSPDWKYTEGYAPFYINDTCLDITYSDNINIGAVQMTINGKGLLSGAVTGEFSISSADPEDDVIDRSGCGLQYRVEEDHVVIVGYIASALPANLVIPETLEGLPVTVIDFWAFKDCGILTEVTIPGTVTDIEYHAFLNAANLKTVRFTGDMPYISSETFSGGTGYYPAGNDTWDVSKRKHSGIDEWVSDCANHALGEWVTELEPTCITDGQRTRRCPTCNAAETEVIPATGHTVVTDAAVAATCTESGLTEGSHCSVCNEVLVARNVVPATGHAYTAVVTKPTCTEGGHTTYTCHCGDSYVDDYTDVQAHTQNGWIMDDEQHWSYCTHGHKYDGAPHSYTDDTDESCEVCGHEREVEAPAALLGDVDGSSDVNFFDGMYVLQYYAGVIDASALNVSAADVDGNGSIDFFDGMYILQYYAGVLDKLPAKT